MQPKCNRKNGQKRRDSEKAAMKYPQMPRGMYRTPHYPSSKQLVGKAIDAGVALGTVAIGASVVTGVIGALTKK